MTMRSIAALAFALTLLAGCAGGVRVVRSNAAVRVAPASVAIEDFGALAAEGPRDAEVLRAFASALDENLPGFTFVDSARARYEIVVTRLEVARHDGDTRAELRVALRDADGVVLDEVLVSALGHDPQHAGMEAAAHFGRYVRVRNASLD